MSAAALCLLLATCEPFAGVPADSTLVAVVPDPRDFAESVRDFPGVAKILRLPAARDALSNPGLKRLGGLVAYYEQDMGDDWPTILDRVAGRGVTLSATAGEENGPVVASFRGTDAAASRQFVELAVRAALAEAERQAAPGDESPKVVRESRGGFDLIHVGKGAHVAIRGATVRVSNRADALTKSLDVLAGRAKSLDPKRVLAGRKLLAHNAKAWAWVDLKALKDTPQSRDFFANTRQEIVGTLALGSGIDAVRRADDLAIGFGVNREQVSLEVRAGAGRGGLPPELRIHAPQLREPGTPPLLRPAGAFYSQGFYLDLATLWADRAKVFNPQALKDVEKFDRDLSKLLPGAGVGAMLKMTGPRHRIVAFPPPAKPLYASTPLPARPGAVLVVPMRDPELGESLSAALRAGAAIAGLAAGVMLSDETHAGIGIAVVRFPEGRELEADPDGLRFHAMPSFAVHKDYFLLASWPQLIPRVAAELDRQSGPGSPEVWRGELLPQGVADWARVQSEPLVADALLRRGLTLAAAQREVGQFAKLLGESGPLSLAADNGPDSFAWTLTWDAEGVR